MCDMHMQNLCEIVGSNVKLVHFSLLISLYLLPWTRVFQKKWRSPHTQKNNPKCSTLVQSQNYRIILIGFQGKPFKIIKIQIYAPTTNAEEAELKWIYEDLQVILELTPKWISFSSQGIECKRRKSRDSWSNRQVWPWSTK